MPDVRDHIRDSRPQAGTLAPLDLDRLVRRARRRTIASRSATAFTVAAVLAGGAVAIDVVRPMTSPTIGPGGFASQPGATGPEGSESNASSDDLDVSTAIDELIAANREAPPHPVPGDGQVLIERTYALWGSFSDAPGGQAGTLEAVWYEQRIDDRGEAEIVRTPLGLEIEGTRNSSPADRADLRASAAPFFDAGPPEQEESLAGGDPAAQAARALEEAEDDAHGAAEPTDGSTERPDQMHAFMRAADALRVGLQPADRIRALQVIARLDPSLVEYRGMQRDLLGREGIAIAGVDADAHMTSWNVLIFDPETGALLGEYEEYRTTDMEAPVIATYAARETVLLDTTG